MTIKKIELKRLRHTLTIANCIVCPYRHTIQHMFSEDYHKCGHEEAPMYPSLNHQLRLDGTITIPDWCPLEDKDKDK